MISLRKTWLIFEGLFISWLCQVLTTKNAAINFSNWISEKDKRLSCATWSMNVVHKRGHICVSLDSWLSVSVWSTRTSIRPSSTICLRSSTRMCTSWRWTSWGTGRNSSGTCSTPRLSAGRASPSSDSPRTIPPPAPASSSRSSSKTSVRTSASRDSSRDSRMKHYNSILQGYFPRIVCRMRDSLLTFSQVSGSGHLLRTLDSFLKMLQNCY